MSETLSELERHLRDLQPEQLIILLTQIVQKHPSLHGEIEQMVAHILKRVTEPEGLEVISKRTGQRLEPGTHEASVASARLDLVPYRTRLAHYVTRFEQGENEEALAEDFAGLLQEAQEYTDRDAYLSALDLYGVAFDGRLALPEQLKSLEPLLDQILIDALPALDLVLGEASSLIYTNLPNPDTFATEDDEPFPLSNAHSTYIHPSSQSSETTSTSGTENALIQPLLTTEERQRWLARLFAFWLRRMDTYQGDEQLPEMITDTAWSEDLPFIRQLVQNELHKTPVEVKSNIVDFTRQARIKTLEKFLRELQYSTY